MDKRKACAYFYVCTHEVPCVCCTDRRLCDEIRIFASPLSIAGPLQAAVQCQVAVEDFTYRKRCIEFCDFHVIVDSDSGTFVMRNLDKVRSESCFYLSEGSIESYRPDLAVKAQSVGKALAVTRSMLRDLTCGFPAGDEDCFSICTDDCILQCSFRTGCQGAPVVEHMDDGCACCDILGKGQL